MVDYGRGSPSSPGLGEASLGPAVGRGTKETPQGQQQGGNEMEPSLGCRCAGRGPNRVPPGDTLLSCDGHSAHPWLGLWALHCRGVGVGTMQTRSKTRKVCMHACMCMCGDWGGVLALERGVQLLKKKPIDVPSPPPFPGNVCQGPSKAKVGGSEPTTQSSQSTFRQLP